MKIRSRAGWKSFFLFCLAASIASHAQTFTGLVSFDGSNGARSYYGSLVQGLDGSLYGTTNAGGAYDFGTVFEITPQGSLTTLKSFGDRPSNGYNPSAGLVQTLHGNFYGTTTDRGFGTIFRVTPNGSLTTLFNFESDSFDGAVPESVLVLASDGNLYGTTASAGKGGQGTVFKMGPAGTVTSLYSFCAQTNCTDGAEPIAGLTQAADGNLYGTTLRGGTNTTSCVVCGTVFRITPEGTLTTLYSFCAEANCADGEGPLGGLTQSSDGSLYGTTGGGGANCIATGGCGTIFKIAPASGTLTTLYSFCAQKNCTDGAVPFAALVRGSDSNFYGTTSEGGASGFGTVFKITSQGALTTLYRFCTQANCPDGAEPYAGLVQATNGLFYGTTPQGGADGDGTIFSLDVGLGPFVQTLPASGTVGSTIDILSQGLTGTTAVSFNGTAANFTVVSDTYLTATVPSGATTGVVTVTTPASTLKSNQEFRVVP
jgi:uncharacterized repeat protein (TIGR03803 family)